MDPASFTASPNSGGVGIETGYGALKNGAGVRLCSERTIIRMSGDDRASFLHGMCSNDIKGLKPGSLIAALFLTERAHLIAEAIVWATSDALLLEMERSQWPAVRAHLERFLVADDVEMEESVAGPRYGGVIQRVIQIDGIPLEAQLDGTILYLRNNDEPGVIGQVGSTLGNLGVNIATFALGRREAHKGAEAVSLVRLDGQVSDSILGAIRGIPAITVARLLKLG